MSFVLRLVFAFVLVALTFNPTQWNYVAWAADAYGDTLSLVVLAGLVLVIGWVIYLRATWRSIGALGMVLVLALVAALVWVAHDLGWLRLEDTSAMTWLGILAVSLVLGIGLSWSFIRRALSGQYDVDDADT